MTPKYWAGIIAAMLVIFAVGMVVARGIRKGSNFVMDNFPMALGLIDSHFRLDGGRLGDVQRLQFMRSQPGQVDSAVVTVKLANASDATQLEGCALQVTNAKPFGSRTRFHCADNADSARLGLVPFGHVVLLPEGKQVPMYVASDALTDVQQHAYRGTGSADSGDVDIQAADGHFQITVNGKVIVQASGDSGGGSLIIRGANGRPILEIHGDSAGGSVKVTDENGKTRVNINGKKDSGRGHLVCPPRGPDLRLRPRRQLRRRYAFHRHHLPDRAR